MSLAAALMGDSAGGKSITVQEAKELDLTKAQVREILHHYGRVTEGYIAGWQEAEANWRNNWDSGALSPKYRQAKFEEFKKQNNFPASWMRQQVFQKVADQHNLRWARYRVLVKHNKAAGLYSAFAQGTAPVAEYLGTTFIAGASIKVAQSAVKITHSGVKLLANRNTVSQLESSLAQQKAQALALQSGQSSRLINIPAKQAQKIFGKHGAEFGLTGNWNPKRGKEAIGAINKHINSPTVKQIPGTYRGDSVTHFVDPKTGVNVYLDSSGKFGGAWKLGSEQLQSVLKSGRLF